MEAPTPKPSTPLPPQPESIPLHFDLKAVFNKPPGPEEFMFPYVEASVTFLDSSSGEMTSGTMRTLGSHEPTDIFVNLMNHIINQKMFQLVHKPLFTALMVIRDSSDYREAHDAWRKWKQDQPANFHDRIIKQAKGFDLNAERPQKGKRS